MIILFLFLIIICSSCAAPRSSYICASRSYSSPSSSKTEESSYFVKKGDSLWAISKRYGVSVQQLMRENRISSPRDLKVGQALRIPMRRVVNVRKYSSDSFSWPLEGEIVGFFGEGMGNIINKGVNVKAGGDNYVNASAAGKVVFNDYLKGWGQTLILKHPQDFYTIYANIAQDSVKEGQYVKAGESIGQIAQDVDGDCVLHFEIRKQHLPQNPLEYLE